MRSAYGSMRCPSRPRKSWRRCAVRAKASRLGMGRLDFPKSPTRRASKWNRHPRNWTLLRLPRFKYLRPKTAREAARMAADLGPHAMFVAGGTDLFPKLKRRQFEVDALIGLDFLSHAIHRGEDETVVDAGVTLAAASADLDLRSGYPGYAEAGGLFVGYRADGNRAGRARNARRPGRRTPAAGRGAVSRRRHRLPGEAARGGGHFAATAGRRRNQDRLRQAAAARLDRFSDRRRRRGHETGWLHCDELPHRAFRSGLTPARGR